LSGRGLCDELITLQEESYRLWCVVAYDPGNLVNEEVLAHWGLSRQNKHYDEGLKIKIGRAELLESRNLLKIHKIKVVLKVVILPPLTVTLQPTNGRRTPNCRGFTITLRHTTLGMTPLDE
jgi:hypothetical protein